MKTRTGSRGQLRGQVVGNCDDYGIDEGSVEIILRTFLALRTDTPVHLIDVVHGVLVFAQADPQNLSSGVIYVYDKTARTFWGLDFESGGDDLSRQQFEELSREYGLNDFAAQPTLLKGFGRVAKS